jgi:dTDP-4-amino-4,6-dideoxygalactose transaminase
MSGEIIRLHQLLQIIATGGKDLLSSTSLEFQLILLKLSGAWVMKYKSIPVTRTTLPPLEEFVRQLESIWETGQLTNNGPLVHRLASEIQSYLDIDNLQLLGNGTLAIQLAIRAFGLTGEIITTPYSYVATTNAILWEGCKPVFVDIDPQSFCIDPKLIEAAITPQTCAILATHVYGYPCDVEYIEQIAARHGLHVIYDAAHAFGVKLNGCSLLKYGDCSTLSFHATKLFHSAEGGAVICKEAGVANTVFLMSKFGHLGEDNYIEIGINAKMSELHAAMGLCILPKVDDIIASRRMLSEYYDSNLRGLRLVRPQVSKGLEYNYAYYPVVFPSHDIMMCVRQSLMANNIIPRRYFYPSLNTLPYLRPELKTSCPVSESVASRVLCLPLYPALEHQKIDEICMIVKEAIQ